MSIENDDIVTCGLIFFAQKDGTWRTSNRLMRLECQGVVWRCDAEALPFYTSGPNAEAAVQKSIDALRELKDRVAKCLEDIE